MIIGARYKQKFKQHWNRWLKVKQGSLNFGRILANELAYICHYDFPDLSPKISKTRFRDILRNLIFTRKTSPYQFTLPDNTQRGILFFHEEDGRKDYQKQCNFVLEEIGSLEIWQMHVDKSKGRHERKISLQHSFNKLLLLFRILFFAHPLRKKFYNRNSETFLYLTSRALLYYDYSRLLQTVVPWNRIDLLITFSDMKEYSNLITQVARLNGVKTATQQHAVYLHFTDTCYSQPAINYENFSSDHLLAWGNSVKDQWKESGIPADRYKIAGSNVQEYSRSLKSLEQRLPEDNVFAVIMSSEYWRASNLQMLRHACRLSIRQGLKLEILFHPTNPIDSYLQELPEISLAEKYQGIPDFSSFIQKQQFLICHTTTLYLSSLLNLRKCYRFRDDKFIDMGGMNDVFSTYEELEVHFLGGIRIGQNELAEINSLLCYHFGSENDSYKKAIEEILHG